MVLAPQSFDDSPLALLRLARSESEAELRKSLAKASMLALTLCVSVLLARVLLYAPPQYRIIDLPPLYPPTNNPLPPITPTGRPAPPRVAPADARGAVVPVDHIDETQADRLVPPEHGIEQGVVEDGGNSELVRGPAVAAPPHEPDASEFVFTETLPTPVHQVKPDYPPIAKEAGMEGKVVVRMLIGLDGKVRRAEIEKSSSLFDNDALEAARQWTFTPALTDGKPVMVWVRVPFDFRLH